MNKNSLIISIVALAVLFAVVVVSLIFLYSNPLDKVREIPSSITIASTDDSSEAVVVKEDTIIPSEHKDSVIHENKDINVCFGPFKVKNSATGRINLFGQKQDMSLYLNEEDGKEIWNKPFSSLICGEANTIDYYANGKLQILFASGSKLYLIDRLGRFVSGFPVDLHKPIKLGPNVYDFTGAKGYNVVVIHEDNTIEMYDLHGHRPSWWKGIIPSGTPVSLPELFSKNGKKYWSVNTSDKKNVYDFCGGGPIVNFE